MDDSDSKITNLKWKMLDFLSLLPYQPLDSISWIRVGYAFEQMKIFCLSSRSWRLRYTFQSVMGGSFCFFEF